jgi:hypothetical protein
MSRGAIKKSLKTFKTSTSLINPSRKQIARKIKKVDLPAIPGYYEFLL